ncbi:MAG: hypothetical protein PV344_04125 [Anaplasma sp.]|nr:hypothetical protein [Anaplasma sp.]
MLTYCPNCSRDLFFANRRRFAKIRSSRKFSRLQYLRSYLGRLCKSMPFI